jgi:hypothetical protein
MMLVPGICSAPDLIGQPMVEGTHGCKLPGLHVGLCHVRKRSNQLFSCGVARGPQQKELEPLALRTS